MSGKPVAYIVFPGRPLNPALRTSMERSVFLFDGNAVDFHEQLRKFLSLPIAEIEDCWAEKLAERTVMIERFFSSGKQKQAGASAANILINANFDRDALLHHRDA